MQQTKTHLAVTDNSYEITKGVSIKKAPSEGLELFFAFNNFFAPSNLRHEETLESARSLLFGGEVL